MVWSALKRGGKDVSCVQDFSAVRFYPAGRLFDGFLRWEVPTLERHTGHHMCHKRSWLDRGWSDPVSLGQKEAVLIFHTEGLAKGVGRDFFGPLFI